MNVSKEDIFHIENCSVNLFHTGGAGAPTGFARTVPMKGRAVVLIAGWTLKADDLSRANL
ncbi:MAG: hypothetical protein ALMCE001_19460 [Methanocorpusculum sp. MCE]|nr:MAG: hypothetical protein ALMCE001_19460 [Methanocorpusculum sp. MCE]